MKKLILTTCIVCFCIIVCSCNNRNSVQSSVSVKSEVSNSVSDNDNFSKIENVITNFYINGKDVGTEIFESGKANECNLSYARVSDFYLNVDNYDEDDIFVSPQGTPNGKGTLELPYDLYTAVEKIGVGKTLFLLGGNYLLNKRINLRVDGARNDYIKIYAFQNQDVVLDFSSMKMLRDNAGIVLYGDYYRFYGVNIKGAGDSGLTIKGNFNIIENCKFYDNRDSGLQITGNGELFEEWPHDNLILNCTSFNNSDYDVNVTSSTGENADGFACKLANGNNNTFDGCIAYSNSDDGWDLFSQGQSNGRTNIYNSFAFSNGKLLDGSSTPQGDGTGFKLGSKYFKSQVYLYNCVSANNMNSGYSCNANAGVISINNCTAYKNALAKEVDAFNFNVGRSMNDNSNKIMNNLLSVSNGNTNDKVVGTTANLLFYLKDKGYYYIEKTANLSQNAIETFGVLTDIKTEDIVENVNDLSVNLNLHNLIRNNDKSINLSQYVKINQQFLITKFGEKGGNLGANLSKTSYNSVDNVQNLINEICDEEKSSSSYIQLYKATKSFVNLSNEDRKKVNNVLVLYNAILQYNQ